METMTGRREILVVKASGEREPFDPEKLLDSLRASGADEQMAEEILRDITDWLDDGVTTRKIYARALSQLGRRKKTASARYKVKTALMQLGPSGYPFERFIGELFSAQGYETEVGVVVEGASVNHEMDVIATKDRVQRLIECKYSQAQGSHVSIQVPLYVHSRVNDIATQRKTDGRYAGLTFIPAIATNTRFSSDSLQYASHYGIELLSWDFPRGEALRDLVERERLYPITVLSSLGDHDKEELIARGIVTCRSLARSREVLTDMRVSARKQEAILREADTLLSSD